MSILVVEFLSEGLLFCADRNITATYSNGITTQKSQQPKVLRWPTDKYLFGFVGAADIAGLPMHQWLATLTAEFKLKSSLQEIAHDLKNRVESQRGQDEGDKPAQPLIIHLGGFEKRDDCWVPYVWYIRNVYAHGRFGYLDCRKEFDSAEAFWPSFEDVHPSEIRKVLKVLAKQFKPFWFHQGIDLFTFNVLQQSIKSSFRLLCERHPDHDIPSSLEEWAKHIRMQVLMYGAYYEAFHSEGQQYVGGGADVLYTLWPK